MIKSEQINELALALVNAQSEIEIVAKDGKGYGYSYAKLEDVIAMVKPKLNKHGISFVQLIEESNEESKAKVTTLFVHSSGQYLGSTGTIDVPEMKGCNVAQRHGAAQSYLKRYQLQALSGLPTEDNDVSSEGFIKSTPKVFTSNDQKGQMTTTTTAPTGNTIKHEVTTPLKVTETTQQPERRRFQRSTTQGT